jgi:Zn-finger nucleic acid-binding protein
MKCPRCGDAALDERERSGMTVDVCPSCRGVWLDRGELEKLLALAKRELEEERSYYGAGTAGSAGPPRDYDREPPSSDRRRQPPYQQRQHHHQHYKKRSWLENLGEIFD